ncbi:MAG: hypothetical protein H0T39_13475 [Actinobacteria bacterium]|nr:hypothetical protein [Actinomycetota bacterium]
MISLPPLAHEKWFVEDVPDGDWGFAAEPLTLLLLGLALATVLAVRAVAARRPGLDLPALARLGPWMPFAVRVHLAVALVGLLSAGYYLAPTMELGATVGGVLLGGVMAVAALLLITGWRARLGALLLVAAGPIGMLVYGFGPVLERADMLGLALFVLLAGAGRWSADAELGRAGDAPELRLGQAVWALRVGAGVALIAVAFAEKLANPALGDAFLDSQSVQFNLLEALGLPIGDVDFIRIAGAIEVLFGLLLISGALPQAIVVAAGIPFNATLYFFGTIELLGHLPIYAAMLVLLVYGSDPRLRPWCSRLWPFASSRGASRQAPSGAPAR